MSAGVSVIIEDVKKHPRCPHGPTLLFKTLDNNKLRNFFGCSACRERKDCSIFVWQDDVQTYRKRYWESKIAKSLMTSSPHTVYQTYLDMLQMCAAERMYCHDCGEFELAKYQASHLEHKHVKGITEEMLESPSKFLQPLEDAKKEAQYLFNQTSCEFIVDTIMQLGFKYVLCIGAPRIHEYIMKNCVLKLDSFLMDFDKRYMSFNNPMQFAWYNMFNHHFFFDGVKENYEEFLSNNKGNELIIVTDPPFGGRIEPLASTLEIINKEHQEITKLSEKLPTFFVFPYFMEPQIANFMPDLKMLDYKVGYDNHPLFSDGVKGRKQGSPVRIFTNVDPSRVKLPEADGYKYCDICTRWVAQENEHCKKCDSCTSKDGRVYVHCDKCKRCVKNSWKHCAECKKCASTTHKCETIEFKKECFHCKESGHKQQNCPLIAGKNNASIEKTSTKMVKSSKNIEKEKAKDSLDIKDEVPAKKVKRNEDTRTKTKLHPAKHNIKLKKNKSSRSNRKFANKQLKTNERK